MVTFYQPYRLLLTIVAVDEDKDTDRLVTFLTRAPKDSVLQHCAVDQEHTRRFPRPTVREQPGGYPTWTVEFMVPLPDDYKSLTQKLVPLFQKNGWTAVGAERIFEKAES